MNSLSRHHMLVLGAAALLASARLLPAQNYQAQGQAYAQDDPAAANMVSDNGQADPPQRVARIAVLSGPASFESSDMNGFAAAELNYPMTTGDRLYSGQGAFAELQTGQIALRLGQNTDAEVVALTDTVARFGLAGGGLHLREFGIEPGTTVELDTPNVGIMVLEAGDIRVDVDPNSDVTYLTVISGRVQVEGDNLEQTFGPGSSMVFNGVQPLRVMAGLREQPDGLDSFSGDRDRTFLAAEQQQDQYVDDGTIGAADLAGYGDWDTDADYGPVWYPNAVAADWAPYTYGHWAYVRPWGWTWVEGEPWGFAPFHYGRWARIGPRWGWIPGPRGFHPVYAPALVVFVGGRSFAGGATGWFPLGPREPYTPWYHTTPLYMNRVNVTNIRVRDERDARAIYNQRTVRPEYMQGGPDRNFAYRDHAVVVSSNAFASGRPVLQNRISVPHDQLVNAPVTTRPDAAPSRGGNRPPSAAALPAHTGRPVLDQPVGGGGRPNPGGNAMQPGPQGGWNRQPQQGAQPNPQVQSQQPMPQERNPIRGTPAPAQDGFGQGRRQPQQPAQANQPSPQVQSQQPIPQERNPIRGTPVPAQDGFGQPGRGQQPQANPEPQQAPQQQPQRPYTPRPTQPVQQQPAQQPPPQQGNDNRWQGNRPGDNRPQPQPEFRPQPQPQPQQPPQRQQEVRPAPQMPQRQQPQPQPQRTAPPPTVHPQPAVQPHDPNDKR